MRKAKTHSPEEFGLDISSGDDDLFRWFLLVYLLGKPIQSTVAVRTWQLFIDRKLDGFLELGWYAYQMKLINTGNAPQPKRSA